MINNVQTPLKNLHTLTQAVPEDRRNVRSAIAVFTLRWYMRVVGIVLILYACYVFFTSHPSLATFCLIVGPLLLLGGVGIIASTFVKSTTVMQLIALFVSLLGGVLLFGPTINGGLTTFIVNTSIDKQRAQLMAALLLSIGVGVVGGFFGRRKLGTGIGAFIVFWFGYLATFIQTQLQPMHDPGGNLEPLNVGALMHTISAMGALTLLSAFIGAAIGIALSHVLLDPVYHTLLFFRQQPDSRQGTGATQTQSEEVAFRSRLRRNVIFPWLGIAAMIILIALASSSAPFFIFSPSVGLHNAPHINTGNQKLPAHGTLLQESMVSPSLGGQTEPFYVYLPPSYNTPQGKNKHYPTMYLLHGSPGTYKDWINAGNANQTADTLITGGKIPELILVIPDGNDQFAPSEWGNSYNQQQLLETYVTVDLVKYIDQHFRTIPQPAYRAIGGLSMGGFGAMNIAVHHPDVFGTVMALGGYYQADSTASVWGGNADYLAQNSPIEFLPNNQQAWKLHIFLGAGTQDQPYYNDTMQFAHELNTLSIPYHLDLEQGSHEWSVWQTQLYNALLWIKWG